jgi:hypothetical protein
MAVAPRPFKWQLHFPRTIAKSKGHLPVQKEVNYQFGFEESRFAG